MLVGYARVSTTEQSLGAQIDALTAAGCERIFSESVTGSRLNRSELRRMREFVREGDVVVVWKLDRIARSLPHLITILDELHKTGVRFRSLSDGVDTSTAAGELIAQLLGAIAQFERSLIIERTRAGIDTARRNGVVFGPPRKLNRQQRDTLRKLYSTGDETVSELAKRFNISRTSVRRIAKNCD